MDSTRRIYYL